MESDFGEKGHNPERMSPRRRKRSAQRNRGRGGVSKPK